VESIVRKKPAKTMANKNVVEGELHGQTRVRLIDKLDEACTNADDQMMLVRHCSGDRMMS